MEASWLAEIAHRREEVRKGIRGKVASILEAFFRKNDKRKQ
jgi:hypothetical protein